MVKTDCAGLAGHWPALHRGRVSARAACGHRPVLQLHPQAQRSGKGRCPHPTPCPVVAASWPWRPPSPPLVLKWVPLVRQTQLGAPRDHRPLSWQSTAGGWEEPGSFWVQGLVPGLWEGTLTHRACPCSPPQAQHQLSRAELTRVSLSPTWSLHTPEGHALGHPLPGLLQKPGVP